MLIPVGPLKHKDLHISAQRTSETSRTGCTNTSVLWGGEAALSDLNSHLENMKLCKQRSSETMNVPWQEHFRFPSPSPRPALVPFVRKKPEYHVLGSTAVHIHLFWIIYSHYKRKGQQKTLGHCRQNSVKFNTCLKMQELCTFGLLGNSFQNLTSAAFLWDECGGGCCYFSVLLSSAQQEGESTQEGVLCFPKQGHVSTLPRHQSRQYQHLFCSSKSDY